LRNGEPIKKSQGARGQMKSDENNYENSVLKAPYILYEKDCTIQAENDETVATRK